MKFLSNKFLAAILILFVVSFQLTGCGKKDETAVQDTNTGVETASTSVSGSSEQQEVSVPSSEPITEERTYYDFEGDLGGWEIPMWAMDKTDYVATGISVSGDFTTKGTSSMKLDASFPGGLWYAGLVEIQQYLDMSKYRVIRADIYLPEDAPEGLKAKMILTVGNNWKFVEMSRSVPLIPGKWMTINANIEPGSYDWKRIVPDEEFAKDVRKIAIRVESNHKPKYTGPVYIDNVRVGR